jgi:hypothetical protein
LWDIGLQRWNEKRTGLTTPEKRPGVTINRRDLTAIPIPSANLLWRDLHVRNVRRESDKPKTSNVRIDIIVDGVTEGKIWKCGLEFDYANEESFYCRPLRLDDNDPPTRLPVPAETAQIKVAFLPPMSGLADREFIKQPGEINVLVGQGQTAQVLRNMCYQIYQAGHWGKFTAQIKNLFGVMVREPQYIPERSEIIMAYEEADGLELDLSASGRGQQQVMLLLAHLYTNPNTVLLLDEPDAHLEVLRQRQIYQLLTDVATQQGAQIIVASHSEVVLNEAAGRDTVIAFVGKPHNLADRGTQVIKALTSIGFDQYYQAEQTGWVLYLEGPTDLAILQTFARILNHPAAAVLERPFVQYVANNLPQMARDHFYGLREAKKNLVGVALFDRLDKELQLNTPLRETMWQRREIENYLCQEETLLAYARADQPDDLFGYAEAQRREEIMRECVTEIAQALQTLRRLDPWSPDIKATDDFLDPLLTRYFERLDLPGVLRKGQYYQLAQHVSADRLDPEISAKLDLILQVAQQAQPRI